MRTKVFLSVTADFIKARLKPKVTRRLETQQLTLVPSIWTDIEAGQGKKQQRFETFLHMLL